jgi:hypothetical protein
MDDLNPVWQYCTIEAMRPKDEALQEKEMQNKA